MDSQRIDLGDGRSGYRHSEARKRREEAEEERRQEARDVLAQKYRMGALTWEEFMEADPL